MRIISYLLLFISFSSITYSKDNILSYEEAKKNYMANFVNSYGMKLMSKTITDAFYSRYADFLSSNEEKEYRSSQVSLIWIDSAQLAKVDFKYLPPDYLECTRGMAALSIAHSKSTTGGVDFTLMIKNKITDTQEFFSCKTTEASNNKVTFSCISADLKMQFSTVIFGCY